MFDYLRASKKTTSSNVQGAGSSARGQALPQSPASCLGVLALSGVFLDAHLVVKNETCIQNTNMYMGVYFYMYTCTTYYASLDTHTHTYTTCTCIYIYINIHIHKHVHTHIETYTYTYIYTYIAHIYIYIYT